MDLDNYTYTNTQRRTNVALYRHYEFILWSPGSVNCNTIRFTALAKWLGTINFRKVVAFLNLSNKQ